MKRKTYYAMSVLAVCGIFLASCNTSTTPKASLNNSVDSLSYAYGVSIADQGGLIQYLEQTGIIESTSNIEYDYQMRIAAADSTQKEALQKEMNAKMDSLNKVNGPKLDQFIKGLKEAMDSKDDKSAYVQGYGIGQQISKQMLPQINAGAFAGDTTQKINEDNLLSALIATIKNQELAITKTDAQALVQQKEEAAREEMMRKQDEELKVQYKDTIASGDAYLAENAKREGVTTLPSGLQYEVLRAGNGPIPTDTNRVRVHYHGTLVDGTVFDSSVDRKEPETFGVTEVIAGWTEALKLMPVGSKWRLYVPYNLAYGSQDRGTIKPFSNLIFDVELLGIED